LAAHDLFEVLAAGVRAVPLLAPRLCLAKVAGRVMDGLAGNRVPIICSDINSLRNQDVPIGEVAHAR
jgi:hypothetical protein